MAGIIKKEEVKLQDVKYNIVIISLLKRKTTTISFSNSRM